MNSREPNIVGPQGRNRAAVRPFTCQTCGKVYQGRQAKRRALECVRKHRSQG